MFVVKVVTFGNSAFITWVFSSALHGDVSEDQKHYTGTRCQAHILSADPQHVTVWLKALCKLTVLLLLIHMENTGQCLTFNENFSGLSCHILCKFLNPLFKLFHYQEQ